MKLMELIAESTKYLGQYDEAVENMHYVDRFLNDTTTHRDNDTIKVRLTQMEQEQLDVIIGAGLAIEYQGEKQYPTVFAFFTREVKKGEPRLRTIFHTLIDNVCSPRARKGLMKVASINLLSSRVRGTRYASSRDFKSYYHQFPWGFAVSQMLRFKTTKDKMFYITRAAMGHKNSAAAAHTTTKLIIMLALEKAETTAKIVRYDFIIDDVLFMSSDLAAMDAVLNAFDNICAQFDVTLGSCCPPTAQITFRGIDFDLDSQTMKIKEAFIGKFNERQTLFLQRPTIERAKSMAGMIAYAAQIIDIHSFGMAIRAAAKIIRTGQLDTTGFVDAIREVLQNVARPLDFNEQIPFAGIVCTDATPTAWATIYVNPFGDVESDRGEFSEATPIHVAEARASLLGLKLVPRFEQDHKIIVVTDNQSWLFAANTKKAQDASFDQIKRLFWETLRTKRCIPEMCYINTKSNPADGLSRSAQATINHKEARQVLSTLPRQHNWSNEGRVVGEV